MSTNKGMSVVFITILFVSILFGLSTLITRSSSVFGFSKQKTNDSTPTDEIIHTETEDELRTLPDNHLSSGLHFSSYEEQENYINELMKSVNESTPHQTNAVIQETERQPSKPVPKKYSKQFIAISFDGSYSLGRWRDLIQFSLDQKSIGVDVHFTFFTSGVYFISNNKKSSYTAPGKTPGKSNIGFGGTTDEIKKRIALVEKASQSGHEIASHANGHYGGSHWSYEEWLSELTQFDDFTSEMTIPQIKGFRAPLLETDDAMYQVLEEKGMTYDASGVASMDTPPWKDTHAIWHFPLVFLKVGNKMSLSMDYNHYIAQTQGQSTAKKGTPEWQQFYDEVYNAYINYFEHNYNGTRIPINIGHHFSLWNDGVYYTALLDFAKEVCGKPDVICGTYSELVNLLEANSL